MSLKAGAALFRGFADVARDAAEYFRPWTYDVPLAIRQETNSRLARIQQLFHRCVRHLAARHLPHGFHRR